MLGRTKGWSPPYVPRGARHARRFALDPGAPVEAISPGSSADLDRRPLRKNRAKEGRQDTIAFRPNEEGRDQGRSRWHPPPLPPAARSGQSNGPRGSKGGGRFGGHLLGNAAARTAANDFSLLRRAGIDQFRAGWVAAGRLTDAAAGVQKARSSGGRCGDRRPGR